jgi:hypothetical protein
LLFEEVVYPTIIGVSQWPNTAYSNYCWVYNFFKQQYLTLTYSNYCWVYNFFKQLYLPLLTPIIVGYTTSSNNYTTIIGVSSVRYCCLMYLTIIGVSSGRYCCLMYLTIIGVSTNYCWVYNFFKQQYLTLTYSNYCWVYNFFKQQYLTLTYSNYCWVYNFFKQPPVCKVL